MKKNTKEDKKFIMHKVFATISFILSIAYLSYSIIQTDSIITNISALSIPLLIFLISLVLFVSALKISKSTTYIFVSLILMLFISFYFLTDNKIILLPEEDKMVSYVNEPYNSFSDFAKANGIEVITEYEYSDEIEKGKIIRTDVNEGTFVKEIKKITVTVSDGPDYDKLIIIPSMLGWNVDDALAYITKNFMINVSFEFEESSSEKDIIFKQSKNGEIRRNGELILTASIGNKEDLPTNVVMENLVNKSLQDALLYLKRNGISYDIEYEFSDLDKDIVTKQSIDADKDININENKVILTVSKGKAIKMPDLTTMTVEEITNWIIKNNLKVEFEEIYDEEVETGKVIKQDIPLNEEITTGTLITVTISRGQIKMQKFNSLYEFKEWTNKYNIKYYESYEYSNTVTKGGVISYSYKENEVVDPDAVIYVKVSLGKAVTIPSFIGKTKSEAQSTCNSLGIKCSFKYGTYTNYNKDVTYEQTRNVGTKVAAGSTITLTLSLGIATTIPLSLGPTDYSTSGNADASVNNLKKVLSERHKGVIFNIQKRKHNSPLRPGSPHPDSPTKPGDLVTQGKTYTIYVVDN